MADYSEPRRGATPVPHSTPLRGLATQAPESGIFNKSEQSPNTANFVRQAQPLTSRVTCGTPPAATGLTPAHTLWPAWPPQGYFAVSIVFVFFCLAFTNQRNSRRSPWVLGLHPLWTGLGPGRRWEVGGLEDPAGAFFQPSRCVWETLVPAPWKTG